MTSFTGSRANVPSPEIIAIYDIIWHASTYPTTPLFIQTTYTGSRILFRKELIPTHSPSVARYEYKAVLKFEQWEAIYDCGETLFRNFDLHSLPLPSTNYLPPPPQPSPNYIPISLPNLILNHKPNGTHPGPLSLAFTNDKDDDGYPFLHFQIQASTEILDEEGRRLEMCAVGWAKRREFDDEVPGIDTCLSAGERERLGRRVEVDMDGLEREGDGLEEGEVRE